MLQVFFLLLYAVVPRTVVYGFPAPQTTLSTLMSVFTNTYLLGLVEIGFWAAAAVFVWGMVTFLYAIRSGGEDETIRSGRTKMVWGIIALSVLIGIWGIYALVEVSLGIDTAAPLQGELKPQVTL